MNRPTSVKHRLRTRRADVHLTLMLVLTFSTGVIDAVGYLALDRVFTANMTGNVVILGMALTGADGLPVAGPALALVGFVAGAAIAGRAVRGECAGWSRRSTAVFGATAAVLAAVAIVAGAMGTPPEPVALAVTTSLGIAMGMQAGTARHLAVKDVTTVVVTSTLAGLAADSWLGGRASAHPWRRRVGAVVLICAGASVGAATLHVGFWLGVTVSAVLTIAVTIAGHLTIGEEDDHG
ncbi:YoaK family protein [Agromyces tropicus]|uniref:YoaK family protein n=2 Tax=Agromyces tropicus TaxID=555371 RepID=A0ABP5FI53_9MICO